MKKELHQISKEEFEKMDWEANSWYCKEHKKYWYAGGNHPVYCEDCQDEKDNPNQIKQMTKEMIKQLEEHEKNKEQQKLERLKKANHSYQLLKIECDECDGELSFYERLEDNEVNESAFYLAAGLQNISKEEFIKYNILINITCIECGYKTIVPFSSTDYIELESENRKKHIKKLEIGNKILEAKIEKLNEEIDATEKRIRILDGE